MDRRKFLSWLGGSAIVSNSPAVAYAAKWVENPYALLESGAFRPEKVRPDKKRFYSEFQPFRGFSRSLERNVFLFDHLRTEIGEIVPHNQSTIIDRNGNIVQVGEGDCVGHAGAMCCDVLAATQIHLLGKPEKFLAKASVEMLYAGSRIEVGQYGSPDENPNSRNYLRGRDGSNGEWLAKFLTDYGVLHRIKYEDGENRIDLTGYDPDRSRKYRDSGVPDWLEKIAKEHPVTEITNVQTGEEALDAVCAGQPVVMCCSYAFRNRRDDEGFAEPYLGIGWIPNDDSIWRRWKRGRINQWWHAQALTGAILTGGRIGGVIQNSHGDWIDGPNPLGLPRGAYGVDVSVLDLMVKDWFDCYALSVYKGHEAERMQKKIKLYLR